MKDFKELRFDCPRCKAKGTGRVKERKPAKPLLHCEACNLYLVFYGPCHSCGGELFLTDSVVDDALEGKQVLCDYCQKPLNLDELNVGTTSFVLSGTPVPGLVVCQNLPNEPDFIASAKARLAGNQIEEQYLGIYHCSTAFRLRATSRYLKSLREVPFSIVMYNYCDSAISDTTLKDDERDLDFETGIFGFVMNGRSMLDVFAHEINFVYRYMGVTHRTDSFFDYTNPSDEQKVDLQCVKGKLNRLLPNEPITLFLNQEMNGGWFQYLTDLRDVNYHRRILIGLREARYPHKKLLRIRPTKVEGEEPKMFLPDKPKLPWADCTFDQKRELRTTFTDIEAWLHDFLNTVYGHLALRMR
ncbi:MAG: hypothetical protein ACUZ77_03390 [Candidatus Brocadiales bacterium]